MAHILRAGRTAWRHSGYVHISDLNRWTYYIMLRHAPMQQVAYIWEDESGGVSGWSLFSLNAVAPDGRFAAAAMTWLDAENAPGHYEPVGVDPAQFAEDELTEWRHNMDTDESFEPTLYFLALDGAESIGTPLCRLRVPDDPDLGWVNTPG
ncbi:MAG: hypothetical protein HXY40_16235 [Chloroflexi bacterium]|nr:hypothetical protein [Chloroflexota bacterium]